MNELATSSNRKDVRLDICFDGVVKEGKMLDMLFGAFKALHHPQLYIKSSTHSAKFAIMVMKVNPSLEDFSIGCNGSITATIPFKLKKVASSFIDAVIKHREGLTYLSIDACDLGQTKAIKTSFVLVLTHVQDEIFIGNNIGSEGAVCLAKKPCIKSLALACYGLNNSAVFCIVDA